MHHTPAHSRTARHAKRLLGVLLTLALLTVVGTIWAQHGGGAHRPELQRDSPIALNPAAASEIGFVYEAYLSPQQEGGEEEDTPAYIPSQFQSTAPSTPREDRPARGHAVIEFTNDLSRAYVHLAVSDVNLEDVVMLHLHCGRPGQLGPIIVDFSLIGDLHEYLSDGVMTVEVTNADLEAVVSGVHDPLSAYTLGCPIVPDAPSEKAVTISGLETIAREGELYFNLHTKGQTYFGDIRGKFHLVND